MILDLTQAIKHSIPDVVHHSQHGVFPFTNGASWYPHLRCPQHHLFILGHHIISCCLGVLLGSLSACSRSVMIKPDPIQTSVTSTLAPGSHPPGQYTKVSKPLCLWIKWRVEHKPQLLYPLKHHLCDPASSPGDQHKGWPASCAKPPSKLKVCIPQERCTSERDYLPTPGNMVYTFASSHVTMWRYPQRLGRS